MPVSLCFHFRRQLRRFEITAIVLARIGERKKIPFLWLVGLGYVVRVQVDHDEMKSFEWNRACYLHMSIVRIENVRIDVVDYSKLPAKLSSFSWKG